MKIFRVGFEVHSGAVAGGALRVAAADADTAIALVKQYLQISPTKVFKLAYVDVLAETDF